MSKKVDIFFLLFYNYDKIGGKYMGLFDRFKKKKTEEIKLEDKPKLSIEEEVKQYTEEREKIPLEERQKKALEYKNKRQKEAEESTERIIEQTINLYQDPDVQEQEKRSASAEARFLQKSGFIQEFNKELAQQTGRSVSDELNYKQRLSKIIEQYSKGELLGDNPDYNNFLRLKRMPLKAKIDIDCLMFTAYITELYRNKEYNEMEQIPEFLMTAITSIPHKSFDAYVATGAMLYRELGIIDSTKDDIPKEWKDAINDYDDGLLDGYDLLIDIGLPKNWKDNLEINNNNHRSR